jgi:DNA-directed RNA polymerase subunit RPC12/RpoP
MKANQKNSCPSCGHQFAQVEISEKFDCPTCNAKLCATGFFAQGAFDLVAMFIFGGLIVVAVVMESLLAGILIAAIWLLAELWVRSQVIQVSLVSESTTHKPSEVSGDKQA